MAVVFLNWLSATGKSTIVHHFYENPMKWWIFHDFDRGKYRIPSYDESHIERRTKQNNRRLHCAYNEQTTRHMNTAIIGVCLFPHQVRELQYAKHFDQKDIHFWLMICDDDIRKQRLIDRGNPDYRKWADHPRYKEFTEENMKEDPYIIDTSHNNLIQSASEVKSRLEKIEKL